MDDNRAFRRSLSDDLPLFAGPAPSQPGSKSSEDAADCVSDPMRANNHRRIMAVLSSKRAMSMGEIAKLAELPINIICARISELRPLWVEQHDRACESQVKPGLRVDGFTLTDAGAERVGRR